MVRFDWQSLLDRWNATLLACPRVVGGLPEDVVRSGWLGFPPASNQDIRRAEVRLGTRLPVSYRQFLQVTNGWWSTGSRAGPLWPVQEISWFRVLNQAAIDDWLTASRLARGPKVAENAEHFVYGEGQRSETFREEYLSTALQVSEMVESCVYLLNPQVATPDGEWEAWYLDPGLPGAIRYRSFWDLMQGQYDLFECGDDESLSP